MSSDVKTTCVFIGGKQIGVDCLRVLIKRDIKPKMVIGNLDDKGEDTWHESLVRVAKENKLKTFQQTKVRSPKMINLIKKTNPSIIFSIGGTQIIPKEILAIPPLGIVNLHPALLPKHRGRFSIPHAIFSGDKKTGVTAHFVNEDIDTGPIITQNTININENDTAKDIYEKFTNEGVKIFKKIVDKWVKGKEVPSKPQKGQRSYHSELPNNGILDWSWDGEKIRRFIRAMTFEPFSPTEFSLGDKRMVVIDEKYFKGFK